jgi:hypothetical protein
MEEKRKKKKYRKRRKGSLKFWKAGRKNKIFYNTRESIKMLGISSKTFYEVKKRLGIMPRKKKGRKDLYYSWNQLMAIGNQVYLPMDYYKYFVREKRKKKILDQLKSMGYPVELLEDIAENIVEKLVEETEKN